VGRPPPVRRAPLTPFPEVRAGDAHGRASVFREPSRPSAPYGGGAGHPGLRGERDHRVRPERHDAGTGSGRLDDVRAGGPHHRQRRRRAVGGAPRHGRHRNLVDAPASGPRRRGSSARDRPLEPRGRHRDVPAAEDSALRSAGTDPAGAPRERVAEPLESQCSRVHLLPAHPGRRVHDDQRDARVPERGQPVVRGRRSRHVPARRIASILSATGRTSGGRPAARPNGADRSRRACRVRGRHRGVGHDAPEPRPGWRRRGSAP
jgi:hypothetical protein